MLGRPRPNATSTTLTPDPRNDVLLTVRDARSASATDNTYLTTYTYDGAGNRTAVTTPPVPGFPSGRTTTTTYTDATAVAVDGGSVPAGLPATVTTPGGARQTLRYFHTGDLAEMTDAAGLLTKFTYDGLGRPVTKTVVSDTFPTGLTTSYGYDRLGELLTQIDPAVTNRVTGAVHTPKTTTVYDAVGKSMGGGKIVIRPPGASIRTISWSTPIGSCTRCSAAKQHTTSNALLLKGRLRASARM